MSNRSEQEDYHDRHAIWPLGVMLAIILLAQMCSGCAYARSWGPPPYKPKFTPGYDEGKPKVTLRAYPPTLLRPDRIAVQMLILGDMEGCAWIQWSVAGGDASGSGTCERAQHRRYFLKCWGECKVTVRMYDRANKLLAGETIMVQVGPVEGM